MFLIFHIPNPAKRSVPPAPKRKVAVWSAGLKTLAVAWIGKNGIVSLGLKFVPHGCPLRPVFRSNSPEIRPKDPIPGQTRSALPRNSAKDSIDTMLTADPTSARKYDILSRGEVMIHGVPAMTTPGSTTTASPEVGKPMRGADSRTDR